MSPCVTPIRKHVVSDINFFPVSVSQGCSNTNHHKLGKTAEICLRRVLEARCPKSRYQQGPALIWSVPFSSLQEVAGSFWHSLFCSCRTLSPILIVTRCPLCVFISFLIQQATFIHCFAFCSFCYPVNSGLKILNGKLRK